MSRSRLALVLVLGYAAFQVIVGGFLWLYGLPYLYAVLESLR